MEKEKLLGFLSSIDKEYYSTSLMFDDKFIGQYHIGAYILTSIILNDKSDAPLIIKKIEKLLSNLRITLSTDEGITNIDFTLESICLAHFFSDDYEIKDLLKQFLLEHEMCLHTQISAKATDYYLLRYFNVAYYNRYLGAECTVGESIMVVVNDVLDTNGILFDTYFDGVGYPDLAYHCRNLQILMCCYVICEDFSVKSVVENAVSFILSFSSVDGRICYYGRSADTVYGDSCLIMALAIALSGQDNTEYRRFQQRFERIYFDITNKNIKITERDMGISRREGLDSYVYPMVYKIFALSRLCCAYAVTQSSLIKNIQILQDIKTDFKFDPVSGFLKTNTKSGEIIVNVKGHPQAPIRSNDSRYLPLRPLHHCLTGSIPPVPYKATIKPPIETKFNKLRRCLEDYKITLKYTKLNIGFIPYFEFKKKRYVIAETDIIKHESNNLFLKARQYYEHGQFFSRQKIVNAANRIECEITLHLNESFIMGYQTNPCASFYYQIAHFCDDTFVIDDGDVYINGKKIITFSSPIKLLPMRNTKLGTINGKVQIKHVSVLAKSFFSVKFL